MLHNLMAGQQTSISSSEHNLYKTFTIIYIYIIKYNNLLKASIHIHSL